MYYDWHNAHVFVLLANRTGAILSVFMYGSRIRDSLGFIHLNTLGLVVSVFVISLTMATARRPMGRLFILVAAALVFLLATSDTRTRAYSSCLLGACEPFQASWCPKE